MTKRSNSMAAFDFSPTSPLPLPKQVSVETDVDVLAAVNVDTYPDGAAVSLESDFGNSVIYDAYGNVSGARAMIHVRNRAPVRIRHFIRKKSSSSISISHPTKW